MSNQAGSGLERGWRGPGVTGQAWTLRTCRCLMQGQTAGSACCDNESTAEAGLNGKALFKIESGIKNSLCCLENAPSPGTVTSVHVLRKTQSECGHGRSLKVCVALWGLAVCPGSSLCSEAGGYLAAPDTESQQAASPSPAPPCSLCAPRVLGSSCCLERGSTCH